MEEARAASHLERGAVGPSFPTGDVFEAVARVVDASLIKRNRPFLVVRLRLPVVIQDVGQLGVGPRGLDLGRRGGVCARAGSQTDQLPENTARPGPRSMNEFIPAVRSAVANSEANKWDSRRSPLARSASIPPSMAALAARKASAGPEANFAASLIAVA